MGRLSSLLSPTLRPHAVSYHIFLIALVTTGDSAEAFEGRGLNLMDHCGMTSFFKIAFQTCICS